LPRRLGSSFNWPWARSWWTQNNYHQNMGILGLQWVWYLDHRGPDLEDDAITWNSVRWT
jgi:hypothetical protein